VSDRLVIRADGGRGVGSGHLGRCLALAELWGTRLGPVLLVTSPSIPERWRSAYIDAGAEISAPDSPWLEQPTAWVVVDGYRLGDAQAAVKRAGHRLLVIDDHGSAGRYLADVVLDQNLDVEPALYRERPSGSTLLLGPRYALVRREFRKMPPRGAPLGRARRVVVSLGGDPPPVAEALVRDALTSPQLSDLEVDWLAGRSDVAAALAAADMAVANGGSTCWELCALGVPAVVLELFENQIPVARSLAARGALENAGWFEDVDAAALASRLLSLATDPARRARLSDAGGRLVDGGGPARVVARLRADLLEVRRAVPGDARLLWEWVNDADVRASAFSRDAIPWEEHEAWLVNALQSPRTHIFVISDGATPVGQVRFEGRNGEAEVDISVARTHRGRGLGAAMLVAAVDRLFDAVPDARVVGRVRPENAASARSFEDAGFTFDGERAGGGQMWLRYSLGRDDPAG